MNTNIRAITTGALVEAVRTLYDRNECDNKNGGVHPTTVATYLEAPKPVVNRRLGELADADALERVQGIDPETGLSRASYAPVPRTVRLGRRS